MLQNFLNDPSILHMLRHNPAYMTWEAANDPRKLRRHAATTTATVLPAA